MNTQIAAVIAQTNAAMYYQHAQAEHPHLVRAMPAKLYRVRMQSLAARHSAAARRAMGVES